MFADLCLQYAINHAEQLSYEIVEEAVNKLGFILWDKKEWEAKRKELGLDIDDE